MVAKVRLMPENVRCRTNWNFEVFELKTLKISLNLGEKAGKQSRFQQNREQKPENRPVVVGRMVDIIAAPACRIRTEPQVGDTENESFHRDEKKQDRAGWVNQNGGKQYGSHGPGSADTGKTRYISVFDKSSGRSSHNAQQIKKQVQKAPALRESKYKPLLHDLTEKIQGQHIEDQVHGIGVDKAAGEPTVIFAGPAFFIGPVLELYEEITVVERHDGNQDAEPDDQVIYGDSAGHNYLILNG